MGSLITTVIGIIFCALLLAAGVSYWQPQAYIEHNLADTNNSQIESLVADYNNLALSMGHRPTAADYMAVYAGKSANSTYKLIGGQIITQAAMAYKDSTGHLQPVGTWQFVSASCGTGGTQDCFCLPISGASATDITYTATQMSALKQMDSISASRVEFSTVGCTDPAPVTDPSKWGGNPGSYFLLVMLNNAAPVPGGTPAPGGCVSNGSYSIGSLISQSCTPGCGTNAGTATAWTCFDSCENPVAQGNCSPPPASCLTSYATCTPVPQYGTCSCATSTKPYTGYSCVGDGNTFSSAYCSPPGNTAALPCTPTGCAPTGTWMPSCSASCGTGTKTYTCSNDNCGTLPADSGSSCEGTASCIWAASGTCGCNGLESPTYTCTKSDGVTTVNSTDCASATKGPATIDCTPPSGCSSSNPCGTGTAHPGGAGGCTGTCAPGYSYSLPPGGVSYNNGNCSWICTSPTGATNNCSGGTSG